MAKQTINIGNAANDGTGDPLRTAFDKVNSNFTELYNDDNNDVNSVNGQTGDVVLDSDDVAEGSTNLYDKTVVLTEGANIGISGTYPNFTITNTQSITGTVDYKGTWNASTDTPTLPDATTVKGNYYVTSVAGTYETVDYAVGDWIISNGTAWEKVDNTDAVTSVFGRLGNITAQESDYDSFYPTISDLTAEETARTNADSNLQSQISDNDLDITALNANKQDNLTAGTGINIVGTTINNTAPDQTVTLTEGDNVTITGTYPNFTIASNDVVGAVSSVSAGTGISVNSTTGAVVVTNTITNNNQLTNGAGYTTNVGDITGVTAGSYLTGGGTSGTVTVNANATTASTGSTLVARDTSGDINVRLLRSEYDTTNSSIGFIMTQVDTASNNYVRPSTPAQFRAAVTDGVYYPNSNPNGYTSNVGDITGVTAGAGLDGGGTSGTVTLSIESDLRGEAWIIGRTSTDYYTIGTVAHSWYLDGALDMQLENDGDLHVDGDVIAYSTTTSDRRLKDNIKTIDNALDKVEQLRGVEYDWNKGSRKGQHEIGLIAQEVEEVFPFLVKEKVKTTGDFQDDDTAYKSVDYEKLVGVLIESVKELSAKVKTLEAKLQ